MVDEQDVLEQYDAAKERWREALAAHDLADAGFSARLWEFADAARARGRAIARAAGAGYTWPPADTRGGPPRELCRGSGRRGARRLWRAFDAAVAELDRASSGTDPYPVARAYNCLADIAEKVAADVQRRDLDSGPIAPAPASDPT